MFMAHLDTVFSEETELMIKEKKGKWCCPGIGDDTANAAILLLLIKYVHDPCGCSESDLQRRQSKRH